MKSLIEIGKNLTPLPTKTEKTSILRMRLNLINKNLPARVWLPLNSDIPHHVVRITEEKTAVLNSKDKTPYIIYVEVAEVSTIYWFFLLIVVLIIYTIKHKTQVNDIYTSPVMPKLMPSLRHTKSEEHLDSNMTSPKPGDSVNPNISVDGQTQSTSTSGQNEINVKIQIDDITVQTPYDWTEKGMTEDDVWSQEDDEITSQYLRMHKVCERDTLSQMSLDSIDSKEHGMSLEYGLICITIKQLLCFAAAPAMFNIGDVRTRHCKNLYSENAKPFSNDPEDPSAAALKVGRLFHGNMFYIILYVSFFIGTMARKRTSNSRVISVWTFIELAIIIGYC